MVDSVVFDERLAQGFTSITKFSTSIIEVSGGFVRANQNWTNARREYAFSTNNMLIADIQAIVAFFAGRRGRARSWLLKDWTDYKLTNENIGTGDGADLTFQITKSYDSNNALVRNIQHLKAGTLTVKIDGAVTTAYSVDTSTGIITFNNEPDIGEVITVSVEFYVPVRFGEDAVNAAAVGEGGKYGVIEGMTAIEELV